MPANLREPVDMREIIARIVDGSRLAGVQAAVRRGDGVRAGRHRRPCGRHHHQQRADRRGRRQQGHPLHPVDVPARPSHRLPAEHHRLHGRQGQRAGRHDQARQQDDPGRDQCHGAADHHPVRRVVRRRQLRHVRPRLCAALPFQLAQRQDGGDGRRAGGAHHADRHRGRPGAQRHRAPTRRSPRRSSTRSSRCSKPRPTRSTPRACCSTTA